MRHFDFTAADHFHAQFHSPVIIGLALTLIKQADHELTKHFGVSYSQFRVLVMIHEKGTLSQKEVAQCLDLTPAAISRLTESLASKQLIARQPNPANRRQNTLKLTTAGTKLLDEAIVLLKSMEKKLYSAIKPNELDKFKATAAKLLSQLNQD